MVNIAAIVNIMTTVFTFIEGVVEQLAPIVGKVIDRKATPPPQPVVNPNCQSPRCGIQPYYCPDEQLSQECFRRKIIAENNALHRTTLSSNINDDDNENKDKSSSSMSPGSTIMLVFVFVIILAIIGFLFIRHNQNNDNNNNNNNRRNYNERRSSTWSA